MEWWKNSVVYQIYPRSFQDSNGDGIGDLQGILSRLDHLSDLGIDVIWLSPIYDSPNDDNGYDIRDYQQIGQEYGTLADFDELLQEAHKRGIRIIMDLVVNHTSSEHPWFQQSRQSLDNPYRDYYIWRKGNADQEPNNWLSHFGGSAWEQDPQTGEYYLHLFSKKQPDLNWENPKVRQEIYSMMRWWLDRGIDGFRVDAINMLSKTPGLPSVPSRNGERYSYAGEHFINGPRLMEFLQEMHDEVLCHYDVLTVGETPGVNPEMAAQFARPGQGPFSMVFQFEHMDLDSDLSAPVPKWTVNPWSLKELRQILTRWQKGMEGKSWNSLYLGNHDVPRLVSRFGDDLKHRYESATLLATLIHLQQGTPYIYQGDEIGMTNVRFQGIEDHRDVDSLNFYREQRALGQDEQDILRILHFKSRDNARTPMQWNSGPGAGFTTGESWIPVNPNFRTINAACDQRNTRSIYRDRKSTRLNSSHSR